MTVKAKLRVVLMADDLTVAETDDAAIWQAVLNAVHGAPMHLQSSAPRAISASEQPAQTGEPEPTTNDLLARFAQRLDVPAEDLEGACSPTTTPPFLHLDELYWEAFRQGMPERGRNAIGPMQLAGTLLALWFKQANLGNPSQAQAQAVLQTINLRDKNPSRAIQNCQWLQPRNGGFQINPAMMSRAIEVARAYCTRSPFAHGGNEARGSARRTD